MKRLNLWGPASSAARVKRLGICETWPVDGSTVDISNPA